MQNKTETSLRPLLDGRFWYEVSPAEAAELFPNGMPQESAPLNEMGEPCPWPWEPEQLGGQPIGQFHCSYCGGMQLAGVKHLDARAMQNAE